MTLAEALRSERAIARKSQQTLADVCGVSVNTIANWEQGRAEPRFTDLLKLSKVWGKPLHAWLPDVVQAEGER